MIGIFEQGTPTTCILTRQNPPSATFSRFFQISLDYVHILATLRNHYLDIYSTFRNFTPNIIMEKIAVIGSGIAGMTVAYYLKDLYEVTLFEKEAKPGGHTNTVQVMDRLGTMIPVDTGFMVFNDPTYPNLNRLFNQLGVTSTETDMSFGVHDSRNGYYYASSGLSGFFAQKRNLLSPSHWNMIRGILKFFKTANACLQHQNDSSETLTLSDFFKQHRLPEKVATDFIYPMASAIWSTHHSRIMDYPARSLFRFMANHGLLGVGTQFQWKTITGGSRQYRDKLISALPIPPVVNAGVQRIRRNHDQSASVVFRDGTEASFDHVVIATHADEALGLLENPTELESSLLSQFHYTANQAVLHSDTRVLPPSQRAWTSWNYRVDGTSDSGFPVASTHYWMNHLQQLPTQDPFIVSIDYSGTLNPQKVHWSKTYHHPTFDTHAVRAQQDLPALNRGSCILFCGSYFKYGFHEDAHVSGLQVVQELKQRKGVSHEVLPV